MKFILLTLLFVPTIASAQQPRIINEIYATETVPIAVEKPEVSKAYFGDLKGAPEFFRVYSQNIFTLSLQLLVPDLEGADTDVSAEVIKNFTNGEVLHELKAEDASWLPHGKHITGEKYLVGPSLNQEFDPGTYYIKVLSPDNAGKYVLHIGDQKKFPPSEMWKALTSVAKVKVYFGKSPTAVFGSGAMWMFGLKLALLPILILVGIGYWKREVIKSLLKKVKR